MAVNIDSITNWGMINKTTKLLSMPERVYTIRKIQAGDILLSITGKAIAFVPENYNDDWAANPGLFIIRLKQNTAVKSSIVLMRYLESLIRKDNLFFEADNARRTLIRAAQIRMLPVKIPIDDDQDKIISAQSEIEQVNDEIIQLVDKVKSLQSKQALCVESCF